MSIPPKLKKLVSSSMQRAGAQVLLDEFDAGPYHAENAAVRVFTAMIAEALERGLIAIPGEGDRNERHLRSVG